MEVESEGFQFDIQKFKDVVHYIVARVHRDDLGADALGNTKLHKALYYSDILSYLKEFKPITGAVYQRQKLGPTARYLSAALTQLKEEGRVNAKTVNYFGHPKREYELISEPITTRLSKRDIEIIDHVVGFVCKNTAVEISDFSHDSVWQSVPMGHDIPYYAAHAIFTTEFCEADIEDAVTEMRSLEEGVADAATTQES